MAVRFETASGLRLYATDRRLRLGDYGALEFLDPLLIDGIYCVELLFENKTTAKHYRLHHPKLHFSLKHFKIVPKSLFLFDANIEPNRQFVVVTLDPFWDSVFYSPNRVLYAGG